MVPNDGEVQKWRLILLVFGLNVELNKNDSSFMSSPQAHDIFPKPNALAKTPLMAGVHATFASSAVRLVVEFHASPLCKLNVHGTNPLDRPIPTRKACRSITSLAWREKPHRFVVMNGGANGPWTCWLRGTFPTVVYNYR